MCIRDSYSYIHIIFNSFTILIYHIECLHTSITKQLRANFNIYSINILLQLVIIDYNYSHSILTSIITNSSYQLYIVLYFLLSLIIHVCHAHCLTFDSLEYTLYIFGIHTFLLLLLCLFFLSFISSY